MTHIPYQTTCSHPWHGVRTYEDSTAWKDSKQPFSVNAYIEMSPTCEVKSELHKDHGHLWIDRPRKLSNALPCFYGLIPQTYANTHTADHTRTALKDHPIGVQQDLKADQDPLDICVFSDCRITGGNFFLKAHVIGGLRMIDSGEVDDKIIAVLVDDASYGHVQDLNDLPKKLLKKLEHYFTTYKEIPKYSESFSPKVQIISHYGRDEAAHIVDLAHQDYLEAYPVEV